MNKSVARALVVLVFIFGFYILVVGKLYKVQVLEHEKYVLIAKRQSFRPIKVKAERGEILDRNGEVLAYTKDEISFWIDKKIADQKLRDSIATVFSSLFGKSKQHYLALINKKSSSRNVPLEKKVSLTKAALLDDYSFRCLIKREDNSRVYPFGSAAAHVLGFVNKQGVAVEGIEKEYDKFLRGKDGRLIRQLDSKSRLVTIRDDISQMPEKGKNVVLTIDINIQKLLEKALSDGVNKFKGKSGVGIIEDPNSGEILAMANIPNYDPNNYNYFDNYHLRNRAITDLYEPGSTMKTVSMSMLLQNGLVKANEKVNTENGKYRFKTVTISDDHKYSHLTVKEVLEHSSNIGMIKLTERIEPDKFYKYLRNFGFGSKTGIELPGEQSGSLKNPTRFSAVSKPFMSIGYEIAVTPLQITNAYAAIVNGGKLLRPYVMKAIEDNSTVIEKTEPEQIREVISTETSNTLRTWLMGVVEEGTAQAAQISNLLVGGKTGTSQKLIGKVYSHTDYYTSFVGFFPAESPKLVCYIMVDSPRKQKYGGTVAAPIFKNVVDGLIALDPTLGSDKKIERKQKGYDEFLVDVKKEKSKTNIKSFADVGTKKNIKIDSDQGYFGRTTMPSLIGKSKRDAVEVVSSLGLNYEVTGHGRVVKQSVKPGSKIKKYMKVKLVCKAR
jgi:cell division protein FtsI (penicillin-binding protein 3)